MKNEPVKKLKKIAYPIAVATAAAITAASLSSCSLFDSFKPLQPVGDVPYTTEYSGDDVDAAVMGEPAVPEGQIDLVGEDDDCSSALDCPDGETSDGECVSSDAEQ